MIRQHISSKMWDALINLLSDIFDHCIDCKSLGRSNYYDKFEIPLSNRKYILFTYKKGSYCIIELFIDDSRDKKICIHWDSKVEDSYLVIKNNDGKYMIVNVCEKTKSLLSYLFQIYLKCNYNNTGTEVICQ